MRPLERSRVRALALDVPLGLVIGLLALVVAHWQAAPSPADGGPWNGPGPPGPRGPAWADGGIAELAPISYVCVAAVAVGVMLRRIWPRWAFAVAAVAVTVHIAAGGGYGPIVLGPAVLLYTLASGLPPRRWAPWLVLVVPIAVVGRLDLPYFGLLGADLYALLVPLAALLGVPTALGTMVRLRRENARRERDEELRRSAYEERLRIAREVHDVIGHSLSVISMQAGVALHVLGKRPEQVEPSLRAIRQTSKDALEELRGTLAVFRAPDEVRQDPREPLPGLDRIDELVAGVGATGRTVTVRTEGEPAAPPAAVDHAAYRIVQEALTNVVRHAEGAGAAVLIAYRAAEIAVEIADNGPARLGGASEEGNGIAGMRERARAVGGRLTAGPRPEGGFAVRAELPLGER